MQETTLALLSLGFGLGLLHALDADHIMAVSALAYGKTSDGKGQRSRSQTVQFCIRWAIGHGGILLLLGSLIIFAGIALPESVSFFAEKLVGLILISLGVWIFWQFFQNRLQLRVHSHDGLTHVHLADGKLEKGKHSRHDHRPVLVGVTHGLAGSAPVLAIVPLYQSGAEPALGWFGLLYVAMFSLGVVLTMLVFGLFFNTFQNLLESYSRRLFDYSRLFLASVSIGFGSYWLLAS